MILKRAKYQLLLRSSNFNVASYDHNYKQGTCVKRQVEWIFNDKDKLSFIVGKNFACAI